MLLYTCVCDLLVSLCSCKRAFVICKFHVSLYTRVCDSIVLLCSCIHVSVIYKVYCALVYVRL